MTVSKLVATTSVAIHPTLRGTLATGVLWAAAGTSQTANANLLTLLSFDVRHDTLASLQSIIMVISLNVNRIGSYVDFIEHTSQASG